MTNWNAKRQWPMRKVVDRRQDFRSSPEYPDGYIEETLECGHMHRDPVDGPWPSGRHMRRCGECAKTPAVQKVIRVRTRLRRLL